MTAFITVILGFVLTGVVSNRLVQAWQQRNWLLQQRFLGHEKEYVALKDLSDEISSLLGARIYQMQRLLHNLQRSSDQSLRHRIADHDDIVKRWNERLTTFYVRLPLLASYDLAARLESSIQDNLVKAGANIDELVYQRRLDHVPDKTRVANVLRTVNTIQGRAIKFNKELLRIVQVRRRQVYYGEKIDFSLYNIEKFSNWQLVKALFIRDVNSFSIVRPTLDLELPFRAR